MQPGHTTVILRSHHTRLVNVCFMPDAGATAVLGEAAFAGGSWVVSQVRAPAVHLAGEGFWVLSARSP